MEGTAIELEFRTFDLEEDEDCAKDALVVSFNLSQLYFYALYYVR